MTNKQDDIEELDKKIKEVSHKVGFLTEEEKKAQAEKHAKLMQSSASAGVEFAGAIIIATLFGVWLDKQFETKPLFILIFILLGSIVAFYNLYRASENLNSSTKDSD